MTKNKNNKFLSDDEKRVYYIGAKVSKHQKEHILHNAEICEMTVSDYILSIAYGYEPKRRMTGEESISVRALENSHTDILRYMSALNGMKQERRLEMFNDFPFMLGWLKELGKLGNEVSTYLNRVGKPNSVPSGTTKKN